MSAKWINMAMLALKKKSSLILSFFYLGSEWGYRSKTVLWHAVLPHEDSCDCVLMPAICHPLDFPLITPSMTVSIPRFSFGYRLHGIPCIYSETSHCRYERLPRVASSQGWVSEDEASSAVTHWSALLKPRRPRTEWKTCGDLLMRPYDMSVCGCQCLEYKPGST